jgi:4-amino-4-deoxy-L-arabinose transferase-like glycosyltransferase
VRREDIPWLAILTAWGLWLFLPNLGHSSLWNWDESIHMAVARGVYDSFFTPHMYAHHIYPGYAFNDWVNGEVWLHKPILPFWLGALVMHVIGVSPLGLRLCSVAGMLLAASCLFLLMRTRVARPWATLIAGAFLTLPFSWRMVQGYQFGDVTDATLVGFVVLSFWLLLQAIERDSPRYAIAAGAATGLAFLCKSALALTPLGTAFAFCILGGGGFCRGLHWRSFALFLGAFMLIALPWEIVCSIRWPELNRLETLHTLGHLTGKSVENWIRPWDAIFNEINEGELSPLPLALPLVAGGWLAIRAWRRREPTVVLVAIWLFAEWGMLSVARVKVPAIAWTTIPAVFFALGLAVADAFRRPTLAAALIGALSVPRVQAHWPALVRARLHLPDFFVETRSRPGLMEGVAVVAIFLALGLLVQLARPLFPRVAGAGAWLISLTGIALVALLLLVDLPKAQAKAVQDSETQSLMGYEKESGLAIDRETPKKSVVYLGYEREPPSAFSVQDTLFWSGRISYRRPPDAALAHREGYHPYLVSPGAQPFQEVPGVPATSWLRAYDLDAPAPPPPLPPGVTPIGLWAGNVRVLGYAVAPGDGKRGRYAFYLHAEGPAPRVGVVFHTRKGAEPGSLDPGACLANPASFAQDPWFVAPMLGPPPGDLQSVELPGGQASQPPPPPRPAPRPAPARVPSTPNTLLPKWAGPHVPR